jgi:hypothetical protein
MTCWLTTLRDRPIGEHERRGRLAIVLVLLLVSALLLLLTRPGPSRHSHLHSARVTVTTRAPRPGQPSARGTPAGTPRSEVSAHVSRVFLIGYLAYLYGHAPASRIQDATPLLIGSLEAHPPRFSPAMREHRAQIVGLQSVPAPVGLVGVRALVNDGGLIDYPIGLLLEDRTGRLLVSGLDGDR